MVKRLLRLLEVRKARMATVVTAVKVMRVTIGGGIGDGEEESSTPGTKLLLAGRARYWSRVRRHRRLASVLRRWPISA